MTNIFQKINPKLRKYIIFAILILVVIFFGSKLLFGRSTPKQNTAANTPQKTQTLNKDFSFAVTKDIKIKFILQDASLSNQIVVQGQNATAVAGRTFLIVTLKIVNDSDQSIQINTRDYIRLSVNGKDNEWLAPDVHNDPVEVQAISTKYTRVGFPVNLTDNNFVLQIGEIKGDKQKVPLNL